MSAFTRPTTRTASRACPTCAFWAGRSRVNPRSAARDPTATPQGCPKRWVSQGLDPTYEERLISVAAGSGRPCPCGGEFMSKKPARASDGARAGINDDIGEEKRLTMFRIQVEIRESEQRAFDLFLQNLVKGTSHLSLGQE